MEAIANDMRFKVLKRKYDTSTRQGADMFRNFADALFQTENRIGRPPDLHSGCVRVEHWPGHRLP